MTEIKGDLRYLPATQKHCNKTLREILFKVDSLHVLP
jgi:hypothetical protein